MNLIQVRKIILWIGNTVAVYNYNNNENISEGEESKNNYLNREIYNRDSVRLLSPNDVSSEENKLSSKKQELTHNSIENSSSIKNSTLFDYIQGKIYNTLKAETF